MKNRVLKKFRKAMVTMMMACTLLTVVGASSDVDLSIMPFGVGIETDAGELK